MSAPAELKRLYREGRLVPFVGAGVSKAISWEEGAEQRTGILWSELVNQAAAMLGFSNPELLRIRGTDLQILEYFKLKKAGVASLNNWLYSHMRPPDEAILLSKLHQRLVELEHCQVFYTTNYDDFIERAFVLRGRQCKVVAIESDMGARVAGGTSEIVKFHGDFNSPDKMVVTESDYQERLAFRTPMDLRFRSDLLGRAILFLGYSFSDANVAYLFHLVNRELQALPGSLTGRRAYIAVPDPSDFESRLFAARNIDVIPISGKTMANDIASLLADLQA